MSKSMKKDTNNTYGWVCPNCRTAYAPTVEKCTCSTVPVNRYYWWGYWWPWSFPYYGTTTITATSTSNAATLPASNNVTTILFGTESEINKSWANTDPIISHEWKIGEN